MKRVLIFMMVSMSSFAKASVQDFCTVDYDGKTLIDSHYKENDPFELQEATALKAGAYLNEASRIYVRVVRVATTSFKLSSDERDPSPKAISFVDFAKPRTMILTVENDSSKESTQKVYVSLPGEAGADLLIDGKRLTFNCRTIR